MVLRKKSKLRWGIGWVWFSEWISIFLPSEGPCWLLLWQIKQCGSRASILIKSMRPQGSISTTAGVGGEDRHSWSYWLSHFTLKVFSNSFAGSRIGHIYEVPIVSCVQWNVHYAFVNHITNYIFLVSKVVSALNWCLGYLLSPKM